MRTQNFSKRAEVERLNVNLAKYKRSGRKFEIVIDPDAAIDFKEGKIEDVREVLIAEKVFEDAQKGVFSSQSDVEMVFPNMTFEQIAEKILKEGELQLSSKFRDRIQQEKRRKIIELIHRNSINPQNNLPHPLTRIENAMEETRVKIDDRKTAEDQLQSIVAKLQAVLPIKIENKQLHIHISEKYAKKHYKVIHRYGRVVKEEWLSDGCFTCVIEVPAGLYMDLMDELNSKTHGGAEIKVISDKDRRFYEL